MPLRSRPDGWVSPYEPGSANEEVCAITDVLQGWFEALEQGTAHLRLPDPAYQRRGNKPFWTPEELETLIEAIDTRIDRELSWAGKNKQMMCTAGSGFHRLELPQRLAMAQALDAVLAEYEAVPTAALPD